MIAILLICKPSQSLQITMIVVEISQYLIKNLRSILHIQHQLPQWQLNKFSRYRIPTGIVIILIEMQVFMGLIQSKISLEITQ